MRIVACKQLNYHQLPYKLLYLQSLSNFPQFQELNRTSGSTVLHVIDVNVEVRLQSFLLRVSLIDEAVPAIAVNVSTRHYIDMKVANDALRLSTFQAKCRGLRRHGILFL